MRYPCAFLCMLLSVCVGTQRLRYKRPCILEKGLPVCFQGQQAILCEVDDDFLYLDRPVKCKSMNDLVLAQPKRETDAKQMQTMVCDAWNQFWQAPDVVTPEAEEFVRGMSDCPSCPYMDFQVDTWRRCIKGVKSKVPGVHAVSPCGTCSLCLTNW